tara:strand:+ start:28800 stop:30095 length:1296 start_codon:yes stop_codon:yes gene_type:complete
VEPTIESQGSGYKIIWSNYGVEAHVRYIKPKSSGFKAEVSILHNNIPVHRSNPVLDSTSGMDGFTRKLNKRRPESDYGVPWEQIVEDLSGIVIDTHRKGEPEIRLSDVDLDEQLRWRVDNLLVEGEPNLIWADGGTGKSMFALFLSTLIQQGYINSEHGLIVEPGNVLYLDYETKPKEIATRARMIHAGLGMEAFDAKKTTSKIIYKKCDVPLVTETDRIRDLIYKHSIDVIVIDSMGMAVGGELESAEEVLNFFRGIRQLGNKTSLIISHSNRSGTIFGSAYTMNSCRSVWEAKKSSKNAQGMDFSLFHRKANNIGMQPAQSWGVDFKDGKVVYTRGDVFATDDAGELSYRDLVYRVLRDEGSKTREYLKDAISAIKPDPPERIARNVDVAVSKHKGDGKITEENGLLSLVSSSSTDSSDNKDGSEWESI